MLTWLFGFVCGAVVVGVWNYLSGDSLDKVSQAGADLAKKAEDAVKK